MNPGNLHGRVLPATQVDLHWDGPLICALIGPNLVVGASGFGTSVPDALRELADNLVREAVWVKLAKNAELRFEPPDLTGASIRTNVIGLCRRENRMCAYVRSDESDAVLAGFGDSVHRAIRQLADRLVLQGVWIEVPKRWESLLEPLDPADGTSTGLPHAAWGSPSCRGFLSAVRRGNVGQLVCSECGGVAYAGEAATLDANIERMKCTRVTMMPHQLFGAPDCCGCLEAVTRGDQADIVCGECGAVMRTMAAGDVERVLTEMELSLNVCSPKCPQCRSVNILTGFDSVKAFTCRNCGEVIRLSDDPDIDRFFGSDPG